MFTGSLDLEAAEAVCAEDGIARDEIVDLMTSLVEKSVLIREEYSYGVRYRLLDTIRQYGREKLERSGEAEEIRRRHANYLLELAEEAGPELKGPRQGEWLERLETEHGNLRAAMRLMLEEGETEAGARFAWALCLFWFHRGHQDEGRRWIEEVLEKGEALPTDLRARVLYADGAMS